MSKTKIEWVDETVNPVIGCKRGCPYCYAKKLNDRFHFVKDFACPEFKEERLKAFETKTHTSIFVNSMSDIEYWPYGALQKVIDKAYKNTQHQYIFLTKSNSIPLMLCTQKFIHIGKTVTKQSEFLDGIFNFYSIEPILEPIRILLNPLQIVYVKAIIVGAETGNRKEKVIPKKEWIDNIVHDCDEYHIPIFMKNSLKKLMGKDFRQDKLPWGVHK